MENPNNHMLAAGRLERPLELSHEVMNEPFFAGVLQVKRLSGAIDRIPITVPGKLLAQDGLPTDQLLMIRRAGAFVQQGGGKRGPADGDAVRAEHLRWLRTTTRSTASALGGRAVQAAGVPLHAVWPGNLRYDAGGEPGVWQERIIFPASPGAETRNTPRVSSVGDRVRIGGRLQSREYQKLMENGEYMVRNAFEVSAFTLEADTPHPPMLDAEPQADPFAARMKPSENLA